MTLNRFVLTTAFIAAATFGSTVSAQDRDAKKREAVRSAQGSGAQVNAPKGERRGNEQAGPRRAEPRPEAARAPEQRREVSRAPEERPEVARAPEQRREAVRPAEPRRDEAVRQEKRDYNATHEVGRAVPKYNAAPRPDYRSNQAVRDEKYREAARREYHRDALGRYYYNPNHIYVAPHVHYRPYAFRPSFSIGFGIYAGYPVPYTYAYAAPIYVYGYRAPRTAVYVGPGSPLYGGIALEIGPYDADVFVDGSYAGHVEDFDGSVQPLTLVAGTHRIEVQAPGYAPLVFDVAIQPGQVIPYRGDLQPY